MGRAGAIRVGTGARQDRRIDDEKRVEPAVEGGKNILGGGNGDADCELLGYAGDVRAEDHAVRREERAVARGLDFERVEAGTGDRAGGQGFGEGGFVDKAAAGGVDEEGARLHGGELGGADHALGRRQAGHVQGNEVGIAEGASPARDMRDAEGHHVVGRHLGIIGDDVHVEGGGAARQLAADAAEAEDEQRAAGEIDEFEAAGEIPVAAADGAVMAKRRLGEGEDEIHRVLGDRAGMDPADDGERYALSRQSIDRHIVVADAVAGDDLQAIGVDEGFARERRHAEEKCVGIRKAGEERLGAIVRQVLDLDVGAGAKDCPALVVDFTGDENERHREPWRSGYFLFG